MVLFAVNTGLRASNVCGLKWDWEVPVPEVGRSVFVIPPEAYKARRAHVAILNDVAWSIVQGQRDKHATWVFPFKGRRIGTLNNTAWQNARMKAAAAWRAEFEHEAPRGFARVRIHDLRHTFGGRLRAAGVSKEDREALLGHASQSMNPRPPGS
jgi:integrase